MCPRWPAWLVGILLVGHVTANRPASPVSTGRAAPGPARSHARRLLAPSAALQQPDAAGTVKKCLWSESVGCALNPSYMFTVNTSTDSYERLLLQITAMRYSCLAHAGEAECSADVRGWCNWGAAGCSLYYDDADFVGLLLWSNVSLACNSSLLADVVRCSFELYRTDCNNAPGCMWLQQGCYPVGLAGAVSEPPKLAVFKQQVQQGAPEVWGTCAGVEVYKRYASACNYVTEAGCVTSPEGCHWLSEYSVEVLPNPLNLTKPCVLASATSPVESVMLGAGLLSKDVVAAQLDCSQRSEAAACIKDQVPIASTALGDALAYSAAAAPFSAAAWAPQLHGPRLPLPLPTASSNPLKRASALWQQGRSSGDDGFGVAAAATGAAWVERPAQPPQPACEPGLAGRCTAAMRASQQKLRLLGPGQPAGAAAAPLLGPLPMKLLQLLPWPAK